jgi:hypothetical protein
MKMHLVMLSGALALAALATTGPARAMPVAPLQQVAADVVPVYHRGKPHRRARLTVYPRRYAAPGYGTPYYYDDLGQYPYVRGFGDRNPVPRANMRGCTVDLGYGRYESCDQ